MSMYEHIYEAKENWPVLALCALGVWKIIEIVVWLCGVCF